MIPSASLGGPRRPAQTGARKHQGQDPRRSVGPQAPGDPSYEFLSRHARGPVPLVEVDDVHTAQAEPEAAGVEITGELGRDDAWEWVHVRAPDGNLYELGAVCPIDWSTAGVA